MQQGCKRQQKVSSTFLKVADSKGRAFGRALQSAEHLILRSAFWGELPPAGRQEGLLQEKSPSANLKISKTDFNV